MTKHRQGWVQIVGQVRFWELHIIGGECRCSEEEEGAAACNYFGREIPISYWGKRCIKIQSRASTQPPPSYILGPPIDRGIALHM